MLDEKLLSMTFSELEHYGVKGQKWGVRRKVQSGVDSVKKAHQLNTQSRQREKQWQTAYKKRGSMSTADLKRTVERLRLENEFNKLATEATASQRAKSKAIMKNLSGINLDPNAGSDLRKKLAKAANAAGKAAAMAAM